MTELDPERLRAAFARFMTGVTVVTARTAGGEPVGFTANSFTSVSLDPPLLLVCPGRHLSSFPIFEAAPHFGISILAEGQEEVSNPLRQRHGRPVFALWLGRGSPRSAAHFGADGRIFPAWRMTGSQREITSS